MRFVFDKLEEVIARSQRAFRSPFFGFVPGHAYLGPQEKEQIRQLLGVEDETIRANFERQFAQLVGSGRAVSYAAARMGFYELMRLQGIGTGDEVILLGATCSVMVNAVMRLGATPVFSDIDPKTFGSSGEAIAKSITPNTRMIVAQHSFGIPCDIVPIADLAKEKNIFLLEDCALTLGSKINGLSVGSFGDAALFSTDHSKPLNTLIGGFVYTQDESLAKRLKDAQFNCPELSARRQKALWQRFLLEARYCVPARYGKIGVLEIYSLIRRKIFRAEEDFLIEDYGLPSATSYPYPAKLPTFLAALGLIEIQRWPQVAAERSSNLEYLIELLASSPNGVQLPPAYSSKALEIIPLRLVWSEPDGATIRSIIKRYVDIASTWFMAPIIVTKEPLERLGYHKGSCPKSETIGLNMVNMPCNIDRIWANKLASLIQNRTYDKA